jgi:perosamine synthetase
LNQLALSKLGQRRVRVLPGTSRLAVDGGTPIVPSGFVMHSRWPRIEPNDLEGLMQVLRSGLLTEMSGRSAVQNFEDEMGLWLKRRYALTTNSGTAALHCALAGLGVQSGDEVIVPALTYIACAAAVLHQQAIPIFADVDPLTYNVTAASVETCISARTKAIMVVHLHGLPADMDAIEAVANKHGIPILEDFSQATGAAFRGRVAGSMGAVSASSLMAGKNLPSGGEAGILVTDDRELRNRAATLKCFGEAVGADYSRSLLHETAGWNYRINLLSMVMASQQLFRLDAYNDRRISSASVLNETLARIPGFGGPSCPPGARHVYHMYRFRFDPAAAGLSISVDQAREALKQVFLAEGLPLVEFQNVPLPGHPLMQRKVGYGNGCPWSCHHRDDLVYRIEDYPGALEAIRNSLVIGLPAQAPLVNEEVVSHYVRCFEKVGANLRSFERFASAISAEPPWKQPARLF